MRRIRYSVATSLDGYIAGPNDENDWIIMDPDIDFEALTSGFDTVLMGRRTFEVAAAEGGGAMPGMKVFVVSRTLKQEDHPDVTVIGGALEDEIASLRAEPGKDIWLFGGGVLFRSLLDMGLVDAVEVAVVPVLLGAGKPLLSPPGKREALRLVGSRVYEKTGIVALEYAVDSEAS
jgi:dihydrofolate reductase